MGGTYSLYGRRKDNDKYEFLQELEEHQMDIFKHNVVAYALDKKHLGMKSLYLYKGYMRLAKAIVDAVFGDDILLSAFAAEWDSCEERLDHTLGSFGISAGFGGLCMQVHLHESISKILES